MDRQYDALFNLQDEDDRHYHLVIPQCDVNALLSYLRE